MKGPGHVFIIAPFIRQRASGTRIEGIRHVQVDETQNHFHVKEAQQFLHRDRDGHPVKAVREQKAFRIPKAFMIPREIARDRDAVPIARIKYVGGKDFTAAELIAKMKKTSHPQDFFADVEIFGRNFLHHIALIKEQNDLLQIVSILVKKKFSGYLAEKMEMFLKKEDESGNTPTLLADKNRNEARFKCFIEAIITFERMNKGKSASSADDEDIYDSALEDKESVAAPVRSPSPPLPELRSKPSPTGVTRRIPVDTTKEQEKRKAQHLQEMAFQETDLYNVTNTVPTP